MKNFLYLTISWMMLCLFFAVHESFASNFQSPVTVTATTTSTQVLPGNAHRNYLIVINTGSNPIVLKAGSAQTMGEGIYIPAGGNYEPIQAPQNSIWIETTMSTSTVTLVEGNLIYGGSQQ
jgi:hypothetical protein